MKYKLDKSDSIEVFGKTIYRIVCVTPFGDVKAGEKGGYIESESNLSMFDNCWVFGDGMVFGNGMVFGDGMVFDNGRVSGDGMVYGNGKVFGNGRVSGDGMVFDNGRVSGDGRVFGDGKVYGDARVSGNGRVESNRDLMWITKIGSDDSTLTIFKTEDGFKLSRGCFFGTFEKFKEAVSKKPENDKHRKEYEALYPLIELRFGKVTK